LKKHSVFTLWGGNFVPICAQVLYNETRDTLTALSSSPVLSAALALLLTYPLEVIGALYKTRAMSFGTYQLSHAWSGLFPYFLHNLAGA
jgi:hypothetical protein